MKHKDAPIRLYETKDGRRIIWTETIPSWEGTIPTQELDKPHWSWKLIRGFSSESSLKDWMQGAL